MTVLAWFLLYLIPTVCIFWDVGSRHGGAYDG